MVRQQFSFVHSEKSLAFKQFYLNPLDYCFWDELGETIKWNRVTSEKSLIVGLKRAVKEVLCLKVARLGSIDYIGCHKTR